MTGKNITMDEKFNLIGENITNAIFKASEESIPNKTVTIRHAEHPWITFIIKRLIRKRKHIYQKFKQTKHDILWAKSGWSGGAMVLGKFLVPGRATIWIR